MSLQNKLLSFAIIIFIAVFSSILVFTYNIAKENAEKV